MCQCSSELHFPSGSVLRACVYVWCTLECDNRACRQYAWIRSAGSVVCRLYVRMPNPSNVHNAFYKGEDGCGSNQDTFKSLQKTWSRVSCVQTRWKASCRGPGHLSWRTECICQHPESEVCWSEFEVPPRRNPARDGTCVSDPTRLKRIPTGTAFQIAYLFCTRRTELPGWNSLLVCQTVEEAVWRIAGLLQDVEPDPLLFCGHTPERLSDIASLWRCWQNWRGFWSPFCDKITRDHVTDHASVFGERVHSLPCSESLRSLIGSVSTESTGLCCVTVNVEMSELQEKSQIYFGCLLKRRLKQSNFTDRKKRTHRRADCLRTSIPL